MDDVAKNEFRKAVFKLTQSSTFAEEALGHISKARTGNAGAGFTARAVNIIELIGSLQRDIQESAELDIRPR